MSRRNVWPHEPFATCSELEIAHRRAGRFECAQLMQEQAEALRAHGVGIQWNGYDNRDYHDCGECTRLRALAYS